MKRIFILLPVLMFFSSCSSIGSIDFFWSKISVREAVSKKEEMDKSENPAHKYLIIRELKEKKVKIENVIVKDVVPSGNIDYSFCVIVSVNDPKGMIDCYLYSDDIVKISRLIKGKTRINAVGKFERFFSLLDESYTKIEIVETHITIL